MNADQGRFKTFKTSIQERTFIGVHPRESAAHCLGTRR
jgi:hypothetical protein